VARVLRVVGLARRMGQQP